MSAARDGLRRSTGYVMLTVLVLLALLAFVAFKQRDTDEDPVVAMKEGIAWLEKYQYGKAYESFDRLTKRHPRWSAAWVNKGIAALNLLDTYLPIAEEAFETALELDPANPHALHGLGILYRHTSRFAEALKMFSELAKVDPETPFGQFFLGTTLMDQNRYEEALAPPRSDSDP